MQILHGYITYTDRLFGCVFLVARCNIRATWEIKKKTELQNKKYIEEFVWGPSLFSLHALFLMSFFVALFFYSLPFVYCYFTQEKKFCSRKWWKKGGGEGGRGGGGGWCPLPLVSTAMEMENSVPVFDFKILKNGAFWWVKLKRGWHLFQCKKSYSK